MIGFNFDERSVRHDLAHTALHRVSNRQANEGLIANFLLKAAGELNYEAATVTRQALNLNSSLITRLRLLTRAGSRWIADRKRLESVDADEPTLAFAPR